MSAAAREIPRGRRRGNPTDALRQASRTRASILISTDVHAPASRCERQFATLASEKTPVLLVSQLLDTLSANSVGAGDRSLYGSPISVSAESLRMPPSIPKKTPFAAASSFY